MSEGTGRQEPGFAAMPLTGGDQKFCLDFIMRNTNFLNLAKSCDDALELLHLASPDAVHGQ